MKTYTFNGSIYNRARHEPGEVAWANVLNPLENRESTGKWRPVVIVASDGGCAHAIGLTSKPVRVTNGTRRPAISVPGLVSPSYIWSDKLVRVCRLDFGYHVGWIGEEQLLTLLQEVQIPARLRSRFQLAVFRRLVESL